MDFPIIIIVMTVLTSIKCEERGRVITTLKYSKYRVKPTIVNGDPVENTRVPYIVSIKNRNKEIEAKKWLWTNLCGGTIISEWKVLTAAHCFEENNYLYANNTDLLRVVAGDVQSEIIHLGNTETTEKSQWRKIKRVILNKHFLFPSNDIALLYVDEKWRFNGYVNYINPATKSADYPNTCYSAGYGRMGDESYAQRSPNLLLARIKTLPRWQCSVLWQMNMNNFICTDSTFGDVAKGDSGGPLVCAAILNKEQSGDEFLVGVVSGKNFDKTTLYTRVSAYHDWLQRDCANKLTAPMFIIIPILLIYLLFLFNGFIEA